jgi:hypothetical protein
VLSWNAIKRRILKNALVAMVRAHAKGFVANASATICEVKSCPAVSFHPMPNGRTTARLPTLPSWSTAARLIDQSFAEPDAGSATK